MGKRGPKSREFDWEKMNAVLQFGARLMDCVDIIGFSDTHIQAKIKKEFNLTFEKYRELKMSKMRLKLLQKQVDVALNGNVTMLIWLGKQHLGQTEKVEQYLKEGDELEFL